MKPLDFETAHERPGHPFVFLWRLLGCIRLDEVCVLQGAPLLGACYAMHGLALVNLWTIALLVAGNLCLVAHVFVLNDWAGIDSDARDPYRASGTFMSKGVRRSEVGALAIALLALGLLLFSAISATAVAVALAIAALSTLYSAPGVHGKGRPLFNSALHLAGGTLHFLLGYSAFSFFAGPSVAMGFYFGIVFAAGHLTHEARDHDGDRLNGIRTNAVAFGRRPVVLASLLLFTVGYALLAGLALSGIVARWLALLAALLYPVHLLATLRALSAGLDFKSLRHLQDCYRRIHAVIGLAMLVAAAHSWW